MRFGKLIKYRVSDVCKEELISLTIASFRDILGAEDLKWMKASTIRNLSGKKYQKGSFFAIKAGQS